MVKRRLKNGGTILQTSILSQNGLSNGTSIMTFVRKYSKDHTFQFKSRTIKLKKNKKETVKKQTNRSNGLNQMTVTTMNPTSSL